MFATTDCASNGVPSWNLTPWRRVKVYVLPSGETDHLVARSGVTCRFGVSQTSVSKTLTSIGPTSRAPVVAGLRVSGGSAQPMVSVVSLALEPPEPPPAPAPPPDEQAATVTAAVARAMADSSRLNVSLMQVLL